MARTLRSRYKKNNFFSKVIIGIIFILLIWGMGGRFFQKTDGLRELVDASILKNKKISLEVKRINSPKSKIEGYLLEDNTNPIISLNFIFKNAGFASDDHNKQGLAQMTALLLTEGAGEYDAEKLKEELEVRAIDISFEAKKDDFEGSLLTTKNNLKKAIYWLKLMLTSPKLKDDHIKRVKIQLLDAIKRQKEQPYNELNLEFAKKIYDKHPYSRNPLGRKEDIEKINVNDLRNFIKNSLVKNNLVVGIAGDIDENEASILLDEVFGDLPQSGKINFVRNADVKFDGSIKTVVRSAGQNILLAAMPSVARNHKDFYPLFVANYIWGGSGLTSKLSQQIREQEGLTYGIYSYMELDDKAPLMLVSFSATKENFIKAKKMLKEETIKFVKKGIMVEELEKAKNYLVASYNLRFASIQNIAQILTAMQKYDLGLDFLQKRNEYIKQIELKDVNDVIKNYFEIKNMTGVEIGEF